MKDDSKILELEEKHRAERRSRQARFRKWLRYLPRRSNLGKYPIIRNFAEAAKKRPYLWAFRMVEVRRAIYLSTVIALLPLYLLQTVIAFAAAIYFRANLGVTLGIQLAINPLTATPLYYVAYRAGVWLLAPLVGDPHPPGFGFYSLSLGGLLVGLLLSLILDLLVRFAVWETKKLRERHHRTKLAADEVRARGAVESPPEEAAPAD
jgi:uncharacterized protein (DUF2062 family)